MIHFEHTALLYLLLLIPAAVGVYIMLWMRRKARMRLFADAPLQGVLLPDQSRRRPHIKFGLLMLAFMFLVVTVANPQVGIKSVKGERKGSDIAICLDVSRSMMAEDVSPNRLSRSQRTVSNLMDKMAGDKVSLVFFAGSSFIQMPLTSDYGAAKMFVEQSSCDLISAQGTAIGDAIETAMSSLGYGDPDREWKKRQSRAIIVISDGENFEDDAVEAARKAAKEGVMVCCIGMGTATATPIPEYHHGRKVGYKQDREGNVITTQLNEQMLIDLAHAGKGIYVRTGNINAGIGEILHQLESLEKDNYGSSLFNEFESRYQYPLVMALFCLLAELLVMERRNSRFQISRVIKRD